MQQFNRMENGGLSPSLNTIFSVRHIAVKMRKPLQKKSLHYGLIPKKKISKLPSTTKSKIGEPPFSHLLPSAFL
jgi:hypothetical protein